MLLDGWQRTNNYFQIPKIIFPLQLSLSNPSYTMTILISIAEYGSVELTTSDTESGSVSFFFHKSPKQV